MLILLTIFHVSKHFDFQLRVKRVPSKALKIGNGAVSRYPKFIRKL